MLQTCYFNFFIIVIINKCSISPGRIILEILQHTNVEKATQLKNFQMVAPIAKYNRGKSVHISSRFLQVICHVLYVG